MRGRTRSSLHHHTGTNHDPVDHDLTIGRYYLHTAERRIRHTLADLWDNDDVMTTQAADDLFSINY